MGWVPGGNHEQEKVEPQSIPKTVTPALYYSVRNLSKWTGFRVYGLRFRALVLGFRVEVQSVSHHSELLRALPVSPI